MKFIFEDGLPKLEGELQCEDTRSVIYIVSAAEAADALGEAGIAYDGEINFSDIRYSKVEAEQDYYAGTLTIPHMIDLLGSRFKLMFWINRKNIVVACNDDYAMNIIAHLRKKHIKAEEHAGKFLSMFLNEITIRDAVLLDEYEQRLIKMEDEAMRKQSESFIKRLLDIRKKLLTLRSYYDQIIDIGKILEENENAVFAKKQLKYFGTVSDRSERLFDRTVYLLDYANQVKDVYRGQVDEIQNKNMRYLTIVSAVFLPLTLITSWYGMNFENMPELEHGYPFVICASLIVIILCIIIFKKKKLF